MTSGAGWTEVALQVRPEASEAVADLLQELTGRGVTIEPPIEALGPDEGYTLDEAAPLRLLAYFDGPVSASGKAAMRRLLRDKGLRDAVAGKMRWSAVHEEDWAESWKQHYDVERVGRLVVRPAWKDYAGAPGDVVISLDPGMAFGTGQHPTTRMCLEGLTELEEQGTGNKEHALGRVLDLGSGSGILAIAAVALGANWVLATDTDEMAVKASLDNAALNGMQDRITVRPGSIEAVGNDGPFDLVLANINAAAVTSLAKPMADAMKPDARLFAGGVIAEREAAVAEALTAVGLRIERVRADGDWRTFVARK
jgi:ribosomal protein L11 methyltransferase